LRVKQELFLTLFEELKRRNVIRVGAAYVVIAWLVIQIVETTFPAFGFNEKAVRFAVIISACGFFPALVFAWIFEITPDGLKKEKDVDRSTSITDTTGRRLDRAILIVLTLALSYFVFDKFVLAKPREALIAESARKAVDPIWRRSGIEVAARSSETRS
jgi:hypothetical protein